MTYFAAVFRDQVKYSFKRKIFGVLSLAAFLLMCTLSCKQEHRPKGVLSEREMVKALAEIYLVEEKFNRLDISRDSIQKIFPLVQQRAFKNMNMSDSIFIKSMEYYMTDPEKLEHIYKAVVDTLSFRAQATVVEDSAKSKDALPK